MDGDDVVYRRLQIIAEALGVPAKRFYDTKTTYETQMHELLQLWSEINTDTDRDLVIKKFREIVNELRTKKNL